VGESRGEPQGPDGRVRHRARIARAEADGRLKPNDTVIEYTGGSTTKALIPAMIEAARRLAREEGRFAGTSSGANVLAALQLAKRLGAGRRVVTLMCDSGLKYMSTALYARP
jgi:cysteine synthase